MLLYLSEGEPISFKMMWILSYKGLTSVLSQDRDHSPSPEMCPEMPTSPNWEPLWQHTISLENTEELKMFPQSL